MFKKVILGVAFCSVLLSNGNAMNDSNNKIYRTEPKDLEPNELNVIEDTVKTYKDEMLPSSINQELFNSYKDRKLSSTGNWATGFYPGCKCLYEAIIASLVHDKAQTLMEMKKKRGMTVFAIELADFQGIDIKSTSFIKVLNETFSTFSEAADEYELYFSNDSKLTIVLSKKSIENKMATFKQLSEIK